MFTPKAIANNYQSNTTPHNPMNDNSVTVTLKLVAKDKDKLLNALSCALPTTRNYQGCRYVNTYTQADHSQEIILIQGWNSRQDQERYIQWRKETGDLDNLLALLTEPPVTEFWHLNAA